MHTRRLGNTDLQLTTVGLGTWAIGGAWLFGWGAQDADDAIAGILRGVELGVNWIDTAPVYGNGQSESLVGKALKQLGPAERPFVATKCSRKTRDDDGTVYAVLTAASIKQECDASLQRLGIETIDLYQMHWPEPAEDIEEGWGAMVDLLQAGKVRFIGVSNFNVEQLQRLQAIHPIASLQPPYNMIVRGAENNLFEFCAANQIGIVAYSPMCKGLLTGTFNEQRIAQLDQTDHRRRDPKFNPPQLDEHLSLVEGLRPIAERNSRSLAQLAIAWVLRRPEVTSAIVGARRPQQIEDTAPSSDWTLTEDEIAEVDRLLALHAARLREIGTTDTGRI